MQPSPFSLTTAQSGFRRAYLAFPAANKLFGYSLLPLSAIRRTVATAAHILNETVSTSLLLPPQLEAEAAFYVDPKISRVNYSLALGLAGASALIRTGPADAQQANTQQGEADAGAATILDFTFRPVIAGELGRAGNDDRFPTWLSRREHLHTAFSLLAVSASDLLSDGDGRVFAAAASLNFPGRNPDWSLPAMGRELARHIGADEVLFSTAAGNIRQQLFVPQAGVYLVSGAGCSLVKTVREHCPDAEVIQLPLSQQGYSYTDALAVNEQLIIPRYADPADAEALACYQQFFPQHTITAVDARPLAQRGLSWADLILLLP